MSGRLGNLIKDPGAFRHLPPPSSACGCLFRELPLCQALHTHTVTWGGLRECSFLRCIPLKDKEALGISPTPVEQNFSPKGGITVTRLSDADSPTSGAREGRRDLSSPEEHGPQYLNHITVQSAKRSPANGRWREASSSQ